MGLACTEEHGSTALCRPVLGWASSVWTRSQGTSSITRASPHPHLSPQSACSGATFCGLPGLYGTTGPLSPPSRPGTSKGPPFWNSAAHMDGLATAHDLHPPFSRTLGNSLDASPLSPEWVAPADPRRASFYGALHTLVHAVPLDRPLLTLCIDGPDFGPPQPLHPQVAFSPVLWARASLFCATTLWCFAYVRGALGRPASLPLTGILGPRVSCPTRRLLPPKQACTLLGPWTIRLSISAAQGLVVAPG